MENANRGLADNIGSTLEHKADEQQQGTSKTEVKKKIADNISIKNVFGN